MVFVVLNSRPDRLGANLSWYIMQIIWCHKNKWFCHYNGTPFDESVFCKTIKLYLEKYNFQLGEQLGSHDHLWNVDFIENSQQDWPGNNMKVTKEVKLDLLSYYKKHIYDDMHVCFESVIVSNPISQGIDINFKKTIALHLRLDDVSGRTPYPGKYSSKYYRDKVNAGNINIDLADESSFFKKHDLNCPGWNRQFNPFDCQAPLSIEATREYIQIAKAEFPDHEIVIVTSPTSKIDPKLDGYRVIQNDNPDKDLYILCKSDVIICSKSLFCFSSLYFGNHTKKYIAMWGHIVGTGITTKYDETTNNFYLY
jgi:hypothetical protein